MDGVLILFVCALRVTFTPPATSCEGGQVGRRFAFHSLASRRYTAAMFIERVTLSLQQHGAIFAVVGGYAVALHGAVRGTVDLDLVLTWNRDNLEKAVHALQSLGLKSHLPIDVETVFNQRDMLIRDKNLIAWNFYNPQNLAEQVDLIIDFDMTGCAVKNIGVGHTIIPVLNMHDLINMKEKSGRPQDLADIAALRNLP